MRILQVRTMNSELQYNKRRQTYVWIISGLNYGIFGKVTSSVISNIPVIESPHLMSCGVFTNIIDRCGMLFSKVSNITATSHQPNIAASCLFTPSSIPFSPSTNFNTVLIMCTPGFVLQQVLCTDSSEIRKQILIFLLMNHTSFFFPCFKKNEF